MGWKRKKGNNFISKIDMKEFDEKLIVKKLEKLDELIDLITELKKGYLKTLYPELSDEAIDKKIIEWKIKKRV